MSSVIGLAQRSVASAWRWWLAELAGMVPRRLKRVGRRDRRQIVMLVNPDETVVLQRAGDRASVVGSVRTDGSDYLAELVRHLRRIQPHGQAVTICLGGALGLRKVIALPIAARDDLEQLLRFEMDRLTPFRAEEVYFAHRVVETDASTRRITVELAVAPRTIVDQALRTARAADTRVARVELGMPHAGDDREALDLLPRQPSDAGGDRRLIRALIVLALVLAVIAVALPLQRQRAKLATLTDQLAASRVEAEQSHALRDELDQLAQTGGFLVAEKERRPMTTEVLADLTRLLPDQAYLSQLMLQGGEVQLHGWAATASDLISVLDQSPLFRAPQFRSPVTQEEVGVERFHLSVELSEGD